MTASAVTSQPGREGAAVLRKLPVDKVINKSSSSLEPESGGLQLVHFLSVCWPAPGFPRQAYARGLDSVVLWWTQCCLYPQRSHMLTEDNFVSGRAL